MNRSGYDESVSCRARGDVISNSVAGASVLQGTKVSRGARQLSGMRAFTVVCLVVCMEQVNFVGSVYAVACTMLTGQYQIYVGSKQKELGVNSMQLLSAMMPVSSVLVFILIPVLDPTGLFFQQEHALVNYAMSAVS